MSINTKRTKLMRFTTRNEVISFNYTLNRTTIVPVNSFKYLGVPHTSNLSWQTHIDFILSDTYRTLGFIRRSLRHANKDTKLLAYASIARSKVEYAGIIWDAYQSYLNKKLESLQNKSTRFISGEYSSHSNTTLVKRDLGFPPPGIRRKIPRLISFRKLYHNPNPFTASRIKPAQHISPRVDHPNKVKPEFSRTDLLRLSFLPLTISDWNALPKHVAIITNPERFSKYVAELFLCV